MKLTKQFYTDLRKYVQDKLEIIIEEETKHKLVDIHPLKVSLINISIFCSNMIKEMEEAN